MLVYEIEILPKEQGLLGKSLLLHLLPFLFFNYYNYSYDNSEIIALLELNGTHVISGFIFYKVLFYKRSTRKKHV